MALYTYEDTYIVNSVDVEDLEVCEDKALVDLGKQGVTDTHYLEEMTKCLVYIALGTRQLEADGMSERITQYRKDYDRYSRMDTFEDVDEGVLSGSIERG